MSTYVDNNIGFGSIVVDLKTGGGAGTSLLSSVVFDDFTVDMPGNIVQRTNETGQDNGWVAVLNSFTAGPPVTATGTAQVPTATSTNQLNGSWFKKALDPSSTATACFVVVSTGVPFAKDGYYKVNCQLKLSRNPPTA